MLCSGGALFCSLPPSPYRPRDCRAFKRSDDLPALHAAPHGEEALTVRAGRRRIKLPDARLLAELVPYESDWRRTSGSLEFPKRCKTTLVHRARVSKLAARYRLSAVPQPRWSPEQGRLPQDCSLRGSHCPKHGNIGCSRQRSDLLGVRPNQPLTRGSPDINSRSTSSRVGEPTMPPKRVHLSAAAALANRIASDSGRPSARARANAA
jgi:hypothetical protein